MINRIISILFPALLVLGLTAQADPNRQSITKSFPDVTDVTFIESAFENARMLSPFAAYIEEQGEDAGVATESANGLLDYAAKFLGTRYRLGATGPKAFDCSGFTSYVFRNALGLEITRSSRSQYLQGKRVGKDELRPGDLVFFSSRSSGKNNVGHVGIVSEVDPETGKCKFIHASTKYGVTYTTFPDNGYYSKHYIGARRLLAD